MAVRVGHASMSENSSANGTKGDQTGKEVKINNWYSDSWTYMFIHPDANVREKHAKAVEDGCNNPNIVASLIEIRCIRKPRKLAWIFRRLRMFAIVIVVHSRMSVLLFLVLLVLRMDPMVGQFPA